MRGLSFDPAGHRYLLDGQPTISVTGVLKWAGLIRLGGIPEAVLERARQRGSDVHALVQFDNDGDLHEESIDDAYRGYVEAWRRFKRELSVEILLSEHRVASRRHRVCGTLDCLAILNGMGAVIDVKTGDPDDVAADLQTAAYVALAREWEHDDAPLAQQLALPAFRYIARHAVRLRADGTFTVETYPDPTDFSKFQTLAAAYHIAEARGAELRLDDVA